VELITEPEELEKANRRLQAVEAKWKKRDEREREKAKERAREEADDPEGALQKEDLFRQVPGFRNRPRSE
jgi:hypothetical protein